MDLESNNHHISGEVSVIILRWDRGSGVIKNQDLSKIIWVINSRALYATWSEYSRETATEAENPEGKCHLTVQKMGLCEGQLQRAAGCHTLSAPSARTHCQGPWKLRSSSLWHPWMILDEKQGDSEWLSLRRRHLVSSQGEKQCSVNRSAQRIIKSSKA